jgi:SnoaL-like domain
MQPTPKEISEAFSNGNFKFSYPFLAEVVEWNIVGDKLLKGKAEVVEYCNNIAAYFASVTTTFTISNVIADGNTVAIDGTAIFINNENKITHVSSCDVYRFEDGLLKNITSYCITTDKI